MSWCLTLQGRAKIRKTTRKSRQNFAVKPLACGSWFHLSFEHFMTSFLWSIRVYNMKNCGRFVKYIVSEYFISEDKNFCKGKATGLYADPKECESFYQCANGITYWKHCPKGLHFNPKIQVCDYPQSANCKIEVVV